MAKSKVKKTKKGGHAPLPLSPRPPDKLIHIPPPKPKQVAKEAAQATAMGGGPQIDVEYECQNETCPLPDHKFIRPKRGGRTPKYCSDRCRSLSNYRSHAGGVTRPRASSGDRVLVDFLVREVTLVVSPDGTSIQVPKQSLTLPDNLVALMAAAIRRSNAPDE